MYLAIDIGGTYTKYGYYQSNGICLQKNMIPTVKTNKETFYHALKTLIPSLETITRFFRLNLKSKF